jgi:hypothetical protein
MRDSRGDKQPARPVLQAARPALWRKDDEADLVEEPPVHDVGTVEPA